MSIPRYPLAIENPPPMPQELDFLINELRYPKSTTNIQVILGYLYNYLPYVKNEQNLKILFASFLNNPLTFGAMAAPYESNYMIIEVMKLITEKKLKVSKPTLTIKKWYEIILKEMHNFVAFDQFANSWKVVPIISGMFLANTVRFQLYVSENYLEYGLFFKNWDHKARTLFRKSLNYTLSTSRSFDILNLSLLSLAAMFNKGDNIDEYVTDVKNSHIIEMLINLAFPTSLDDKRPYLPFFHADPRDTELENTIQTQVFQKPIIKNLNKLSFILENCFQNMELSEESQLKIIDVLSQMLHFNRNLSYSVQNSIFNLNPKLIKNDQLLMHLFYLLKNILFSEVIIFQGILSRFLESSTRQGIGNVFDTFFKRKEASLEKDYKEISLKVLHNLYYLHFILCSIGQGGFDNYNFVYYLSLEISLQAGNVSTDFEYFTMYLIGDYREINLNEKTLNTNYMVQCKVLFVLGLWENYLQLKNRNDRFVKSDIVPICKSLVDDKRYNNFDIIEAAHSVLLIYFSKFDLQDLKEAMDYINLLMNQFPRLLSSHQLSIAIETIGKKVLSKSKISSDLGQDPVGSFLQFLYFKIFSVGQGIKLKDKGSNDVSFTSAQPIQEIEANSSLKSMESDPDSSTDIFRANKMKKPKDIMKLDLPKSQISQNYNFEKRVIPDTLREAKILSIINLVPYLPLSSFVSWLDKIWTLILYSDPSEKEFLTNMLWKVISENMDLNRCEIGIRWWYESQGLAEHNIITGTSKNRL
ncbi:uncharacterized protein PRCAT00001833001 [Priceomyces carsonii]|uniref:uncharacterized protein n=1 Tax=Priceomyces carsonii TaxID=28549 RepID=UPI002ED9AB66|nr:unnamed protein product [Priceomyces carsonii]